MYTDCIHAAALILALNHLLPLIPKTTPPAF